MSKILLVSVCVFLAVSAIKGDDSDTTCFNNNYNDPSDPNWGDLVCEGPDTSNLQLAWRKTIINDSPDDININLYFSYPVAAVNFLNFGRVRGWTQNVQITNVGNVGQVLATIKVDPQYPIRMFMEVYAVDNVGLLKENNSTSL